MSETTSASIEFVRTSDPTYELLSVAEARTHLRLPTFGTADSEEDAYITSLIAAVGETIETEVRRPIRAQQRDLIIEKFPSGGWYGDWEWDSTRNALILNATPIRAIRSIRYYDEGVEKTLPASDYAVFGAGAHITRRVEVVLTEGAVWPCADRERPVTLEVDCGYEQPNLPENMKHAARIMVAHFYNRREEVVTGTIVAQMPHSARHLLAQFKRVV